MTTLNKITWDQLDEPILIPRAKNKSEFSFKALYDHQNEMQNFIRDNDRTVIHASRRMGVSTVLYLVALASVANYNENVIFLDSTSMRSNYSFEQAAKWATILWIERIDINFKIDRKSRRISLGSHVIQFVSTQSRDLSKFVRGYPNVRVIGEHGCLQHRPDINQLLYFSTSSTFINDHIRGHDVKRFPWHIHHDPEFKKQMIERYGQRVWDMEFEI